VSTRDVSPGDASPLRPPAPAGPGLVALDAVSGDDPAALNDLEARLLRRLGELPSAAVAFSGGVDSGLVLSLAREALGDRVVAVTAVSASLPRREREACAAFAAELGAAHELLATTEVADERYAENTEARCYWCKVVVYDELAAWARERGVAALLDGTNADDASEHRPGRAAAAELGVLSPLAEAGATKSDVRALARRRRLSVWDKPAMACLSSRLPHGERVTPEALARIEAAEDVLVALGCRQVRVRAHGAVARIEVEADDLGRILAVRGAVDAALRGLGFAHVALDLAGYRSGSLSPGPRP
jgi:uncharacterized protein